MSDRPRIDESRENFRRGRRPRVVVVGGGFAGLRVARGLAGQDADVVLVDKHNHHLFQPLLYQVATAGLAATDVAYPIRRLFRRHRNVSTWMTEVTGVDAAAKTVRTRDGELRYDFLVLATGAAYNYFDHPEWEQHAPNLKSVEDALRIRNCVLYAFERAEVEPDVRRRKALLTFVLVGAGPTGVELAGALAELARRAIARDFRNLRGGDVRILLLDALPRILATFPESLASRAAKRLERIGVEVRTGAKVESVDASGLVVAGERIDAGTVLWTAGVRAVGAGEWLDVPRDRSGRVVVAPDLSVPSHQDVFVIGDTAHVTGTDGKPLPGVAAVAMQEGRYVADLLRRRLTGAPPPKPFRYRDKGSLATIGRNSAIADLRGVHLYGLPAWLLWAVVHIVYLLGGQNRVFVLLQWAWAYLTFQRGARLITFSRRNAEGKGERALFRRAG
jgi:NADH dehydrogenase